MAANERNDDQRDNAHAAESHGEHADHGGTGKYVVVFVALCFLTTLSFLTYAPWWREHVSVEASRTMMMAVSCMKALLVMGFFMHLIWEANWKYVLTIPAGMMSIFLILMLVPDIGCRYRNYNHERSIHAAEPRPEHHNGGGEGHAGEEHGHGDEHH